MTRELQLEEALTEVMTWVENWSPNFVDDVEWPDTYAQVQEALAQPARTKIDWLDEGLQNGWITLEYEDPLTKAL